MTKRQTLLLIATLTSLFLTTFIYTTTSYAKPLSKFYNLPKTVAIQNRPYFNKHDLTFHAGWLPSDAFNKAYTLGASYSYFFNDYLAWEVLRADYAFNSETNLKSEFQNLGLDLQSNGFNGVIDFVKYYLTSSFLYTPFYNKSLLFNKSLIHSSTSFLLGGGVAKFDATGNRIVLTAGLLLKFYLSPSSAIKFGFRNNVYFENTLGAVYALSLSLGYSFELGSTNKKSR